MLSRNFTFKIIAQTDEKFKDFSPYVPSINDNGDVAFQAELNNGNKGIYTGNGEEIKTIAETSGEFFKNFYSHPDINNKGNICFYAELISGMHGLFLFKDGIIITLCDTSSVYKDIAPLGPTMNEDDIIAFRALSADDQQGIYLAENNEIIKIAETGDIYKEFFGLPVVNKNGEVSYRADLNNGVQCIFTNNYVSPEILTELKNSFNRIGNFIGFNESKTIVFNGEHKNKSGGIYKISDNKITTAADSNDSLNNFRSAFINNKEEIVFYANSGNGNTGLYYLSEKDNKIYCIISKGDKFHNSIVQEIVMNPVSQNNRNHLAVRLNFENNIQMIIRIELV